MRLKRTLALLMSAGLCMLSLTGCSNAGKNYANELADNSKIQSQSAMISGTINIKAAEKTIHYDIVGSAYSNGNKGTSQMKIIDPTGKLNFPEIKCYVDNGVSYINKSYFTDLYKMTGQNVPAQLADLNAEYIGIESGFNVGELQQLATNPDGLLKLGTELFGDGNDMTFVQNGRQYAFSLNADQMVNYINKFVKTQQTTQISEADLTKMKAQLAGSEIKFVQAFNDSGSSITMQMNMKVQNMVNADIRLDEISTKTEAKEIVMPTSITKLTQEQYTNLLKAQ